MSQPIQVVPQDLDSLSQSFSNIAAKFQSQITSLNAQSPIINQWISASGKEYDLMQTHLISTLSGYGDTCQHLAKELARAAAEYKDTDETAL